MSATIDPGVAAVVEANTRERELFRGLAAGGADADHCRDELVVRYAPMASALARRYRGRGETDDDLRQIAFLGLLEALRRFDPERGVAFICFAQPTVLGLLRRHFRDGRRWIRLPRRLQQLAKDVREAQEILAARDHHAPSVHALALHLGVTDREVGEAMLGEQLFAPRSLDTPTVVDGHESTPADRLGSADDRIETMLGCTAFLPLVDKLPARERDIVISTFWHDEPQASIGARWGVSQMQISRLLTRTLSELRATA